MWEMEVYGGMFIEVGDVGWCIVFGEVGWSGY